MKRWWLYLGALLLVGAISPFAGTDVGQLQPVQLVMVTAQQGAVEITTDTGDLGRGATVQEAFADMQQASPKKIFVETAEYLLINRAAETLLPDITNILCPSLNLDWQFISNMIYMLEFPFSQIIPPSPSESKSPLYTSVSFFLSCIQGRHCRLPKFHIYVLVYCIGVFLSGLLHSV